jgi:PAS domain S-box-containing protein
MKQREIDIDNPDFYGAIASIDPLLSQEKSHRQLIADGLEAYRKIKGCNYAALYIINQQNFDFHYEVCTKGTDREEVENSFKLLVDSGGITEMLSKGKITFWQIKKGKNNIDFLIIPLIVQSGITGLSILSLDKSFSRHDNIIEFLRIYSNYYTLLMQNHFLIEEIQNIKLFSEQQITTRTNNIVNSTRELKSILDKVHAGIIIIDKKTLQIADANLAALRMVGVQKEEILGTDIRALFAFNDVTSKSIKITANLEELLINKDGDFIPVITTATEINLDGEEFIIDTFLDISERKKMETALQEAHDKLEQRVEERTIQLSMANKELQMEIKERLKAEKELLAAKEKAEQSDKIKTNILANMQHEFRTPLIGIQGFSKILMDEINDAEHIELAKYIYSSGQRLLNTLNSVLFMSKFESDSISVKFKEYNLSQKISAIASPFEMAANEKNLEFKLYPCENILVTVDLDLFTQAISNLLDNAVKFTKKGNISVLIDKATANEKEWAVIKICDTGVGIMDNEQTVIFDAFRQASEGYSREYEGNGLGLTLAKKMIELMNGKITLESKLNFGSTFIVWLPI